MTSLKKTFFLGIFALISSVVPSSATQEEIKEVTAPKDTAVKIIRITPEGEEVMPPMEIVIEFNKPMVPLGKTAGGASTDVDSPITISPQVKGSWRWINEKTLSLTIDHESALKNASRYTVLIKTGLKALDGSVLKQDYSHAFSTRTPSYYHAHIETWKSPTKPVIINNYDMNVTKESLEKSLFFVAKNDKKQRINVKVQSHEYDHEKDTYRTTLTRAKEWLVEPAKDLDPDRDYVLTSMPGLMSDEGDLPSKKSFDIMPLRTFGDFKFVGVSCTLSSEEGPNENNRVTFTKENPQLPHQKCNPQKGIYFEFSAPVLNSQFQKNLVISPDPTLGHNEKLAFFNGKEDYSALNQSRETAKNYSSGGPAGLNAATTYTFTLQEPGTSGWNRLFNRLKRWFNKEPKTALQDEFGRVLQEPFKVILALDHRKPNFELPYREAMLEKKADSDIPLYVNNLTSASFTYSAITAHDSFNEETVTYQIPRVTDIQFAIPMTVRQMLKGKSGVIKGILNTTPGVKKGDNEKAATLIAQVTPFNVNAKMGHFSSLVWVADLATGLPVAKAKITLYKDGKDRLSQPENIITTTETTMHGIPFKRGRVIATAETNEQGIAFLPGRDSIDPQNQLIGNWREKGNQLYIRVDKDDDLAFLPLAPNYRLDLYQISGDKLWAWAQPKYRHIKSWGFTAQGIYHAGDTVQYKLYLRDQNVKGLLPPPKGRYDLMIMDPLGKIIREEKDITFNEFGAFSGELPIAKSAPVGWYSFQLACHMPDVPAIDKNDEHPNNRGQSKKDGPTLTLYPMRVLISDFTPAPFKVSVDVNKKVVFPLDMITILERAQLHSGGAYTDASATITATINRETFQSKHPVSESFYFGYDFGSDTGQNGNAYHRLLFQKQGKLNEKGEFELTEQNPIGYALRSESIFYGKILVEGSVQDDRGKTIASHTTLDYFSGEQLVGIKANRWLYAAKQDADFKLIIVDHKGVPQKGASVHKPIDVIVERKDTTAAKVKSAGNAYKTNENSEWVTVAKAKVSSPEDIIDYDFKPDQAGDYRLTAGFPTRDGREYYSRIQFYVTGSDYVLWGEENENYLPLIPEKTEYAVGETAKILVKNPYPKAKALITVERFGVIDSFVQTLEGSTPVIDIPVKPDYLPNFYVSVNVFSPRVDNKPLELGQIDLDKPASKIGYTAIGVKDQYKEIAVTATSEKPIYKPRDIVRLELEAHVKNPSTTAEPIELAVVVLDESVFDLLSDGKNYFDPYHGLYHKEDLDLENYSLLNTLVGRMKFAKKGANPGGDGGFDLKMRHIFKYVSYWNPSIKLDENGKAFVEFEAPDNLTGWRVFAIATTPTDRVGLGKGQFKVSRDTEIRPVMPNQVSEGDVFEAGFTIMNRTDKPREIRVSILAHGSIDVAQSKSAHEELITIDPQKRVTVEMPIHVASVKSGEPATINFDVVAGDQMDQDRMTHSLTVKAIRSLETSTLFGSITSEHLGITSLVDVPVVIPENIHTDVGGLTINLSPTMITNMGGAFTYMKDYPYTCWEQKISRAMIAAAYKELEHYLSKELTWPDSEGFVREILAEASNFQTPNGGMAYFRAEDEYVDPFLSAFTAWSLSWLQERGFDVSKNLDDKLTAYLHGLLQKDFIQDYYNATMTATVRAVALEALATRGLATLADLERFQPHLSQMGAYGRASFARAAMATPGGEAIANATVRDLLGLFSETTTQITWAENLPTGSARLLDTPLRDTCSVMETLVTYAQKSPEGRTLVGDKATKMVKTISEARKSKAHWENTQENLHCVRALTKYSEVYESRSPKMTVFVGIGITKLGLAEFNDLGDRPVDIKTPMLDFLSDLHQAKVGITPAKAKEGITVKSKFLRIISKGKGRLYYTTRLQYAPKDIDNKPVVSGFEVRREYSVMRDNRWILVKEGDFLKKGELVRVDLYVILAGDRTFPVVNDPIPGAFEPVDNKLATTSLMDSRHVDQKPAEGAYWYKFTDWVDYSASRWAFYHQELRHDSVQFYGDYLPKGNYHLSYTAQVIADGTFSAAPTLVEEMYNPETYGKSAPEQIHVGAAADMTSEATTDINIDTEEVDEEGVE